ncbi:hypothetical protein Hypma_011137 [Hypsizygus marmoreus]|uniref:Uncharacterized protein n=1 Tax=Hypsizygus marmoreus TaxID=39966 RepID=A0A369JI88_HYPMA|nr:hypothetical protein Hypma_011137 [Hypsizygus marmoreus]
MVRLRPRDHWWTQIPPVSQRTLFHPGQQLFTSDFVTLHLWIPRSTSLAQPTCRHRSSRPPHSLPDRSPDRSWIQDAQRLRIPLRHKMLLFLSTMRSDNSSQARDDDGTLSGTFPFATYNSRSLLNSNHTFASYNTRRKWGCPPAQPLAGANALAARIHLPNDRPIVHGFETPTACGFPSSTKCCSLSTPSRSDQPSDNAFLRGPGSVRTRMSAPFANIKKEVR